MILAVMTASASSDRARNGASESCSEPRATPNVRWRRDLAALPTPHYLCVTPFWFRLFLAGLTSLAAVLVFWVAAAALFGWGGPGGGLGFTISAGVALLAAGVVIRALKLLDWREWIRFAVTRHGLYFPGRKRRVVFVPWSSVGAIDVERWYAKREYSAARLTLTLDDETWSRFGRTARITGEGSVRRLSIIGIDWTGDEIAARIKACRADSPARG